MLNKKKKKKRKTVKEPNSSWSDNVTIIAVVSKRTRLDKTVKRFILRVRVFKNVRHRESLIYLFFFFSKLHPL